MLAESSITIATVGSPVRRSDSVNSAIMNTTMANSVSRRTTNSDLNNRPAVLDSRA